MSRDHNIPASKGFTLIELSIVLVIVGLIAGGILVGRDLIRAAELRAVISEVEKFQAAINAFRTKYNCLPGDCPNATDFWPADVACPIAPSSTTPRMETCGGRGEGRINDWTTPNPVGSYYTHPQAMFRFWQHLANAGLIPGAYSGTHVEGGAATESAAVGINIPQSKLGDAGWIIHYWQADATAPYDGKYSNRHYLSLVASDTGGRNPFYPMAGQYVGALNPQEAYNIDIKMDDGVPYMGAVIPFGLFYVNSLTTKCMTAATMPNNYLMSNNASDCAPSFAAGF